MPQTYYEERKPILKDGDNPLLFNKDAYHASGINLDQQEIILQPIEFDPRHKNMYGYYALMAAVLVILNYIMLSERTCQVSLANGYQTYDLVQSFHIIGIIVALIVFTLSYFHFALVLSDFKLLFYSIGCLLTVCSMFLLYNGIAMVWMPCISISQAGVGRRFDSSAKLDRHNLFTAGDSIGIVVFVFDLLATMFLLLSARRYLFFKH